MKIILIYDKDNEYKVDFGIYNIHRPESRAFVNGYERTILLDFNVDGDILDMMWMTGLDSIGSGNPYRDMFDYCYYYMN